MVETRSQNTTVFLQVLRRFFSYRGYPKLLISDNGSQMVGAERELRLMIEGLDKAKLKEFCADRGMKWQFTTPLAPHHNGCSDSRELRNGSKERSGPPAKVPVKHYIIVDFINFGVSCFT